MRRLSLSGTALLLSFSLFACAGKAPDAPPSVALAMDGPSLALFGEYAGMPVAGSMDRGCMAGRGSMRIEAVDSGANFVCIAALDHPPTHKGRVRGVLRCADGKELLFSLRNIGPDQGVGVGRENPEGDLLILFYHASPDEAARRFPAVKADILAARARGG